MNAQICLQQVALRYHSQEPGAVYRIHLSMEGGHGPGSAAVTKAVAKPKTKESKESGSKGANTNESNPKPLWTRKLQTYETGSAAVGGMETGGDDRGGMEMGGGMGGGSSSSSSSSSSGPPNKSTPRLASQPSAQPAQPSALETYWGTLTDDPLDTIGFMSYRRLLEAMLRVEVWKAGAAGSADGPPPPEPNEDQGDRDQQESEKQPVDKDRRDDLTEEKLEAPESTPTGAGTKINENLSPFKLQNVVIARQSWMMSRLGQLKAQELTRVSLKIEKPGFIGVLIIKLCWQWPEDDLPGSRLHPRPKISGKVPVPFGLRKPLKTAIDPTQQRVKRSRSRDKLQKRQKEQGDSQIEGSHGSAQGQSGTGTGAHGGTTGNSTKTGNKSSEKSSETNKDKRILPDKKTLFTPPATFSPTKTQAKKNAAQKQADREKRLYSGKRPNTAPNTRLKSSERTKSPHLEGHRTKSPHQIEEESAPIDHPATPNDLYIASKTTVARPSTIGKRELQEHQISKKLGPSNPNYLLGGPIKTLRQKNMALEREAEAEKRAKEALLAKKEETMTIMRKGMIQFRQDLKKMDAIQQEKLAEPLKLVKCGLEEAKRREEENLQNYLQNLTPEEQARRELEALKKACMGGVVYPEVVGDESKVKETDWRMKWTSQKLMYPGRMDNTRFLGTEKI